MRPKLAARYKTLKRERDDGGWTHGWFLYKLDQEFCLTQAEKHAICKALGYKDGWTLQTEYILYRQWQKDQIIAQILAYQNTPTLETAYASTPSLFSRDLKHPLVDLLLLGD